MKETGTITRLKVREFQSMSWVTGMKETSLVICAMDKERVTIQTTVDTGVSGRTTYQ